MMPANRILMAGRAGGAGRAGRAGGAGGAGGAEGSRPSCLSRPSCPSRLSCPSARLTPRRLNEFVHGLRLVERLADRQASAHPTIELARLQQLVVASLRRDLSAVE